MGIRRHKVLLDQTAAGTGSWIRLDSRYEVDPERALQVSITAGDTLTLEGTTVDPTRLNPDVPFDPDTDILAPDITTLIAYVADDNDILTGNWTYIRATKTGATGPAKIQGMF